MCRRSFSPPSQEIPLSTCWWCKIFLIRRCVLSTPESTLHVCKISTIDVDAASWTAPPSYGAPEGSTLPYPLVVDNTEGIGAAAHVLAIHGFGADVGADAEPVLVVDLGGGQFDGVPDWCSTHAPHCTVLIADPFQRTPDHNEQVRTACQDTMVHTPLKCRQ